MSTQLQDIDWWKKITKSDVNFDELSSEIFKYQVQHNLVFKQWVDFISTFSKSKINTPIFLPIAFFKTHDVICGTTNQPTIFESSGTTSTINSEHIVKDIELYKKSFLTAFEFQYGSVDEYCILGLLPSYLERNNSSLVYMVDDFIKRSNHPNSNFYLNNIQDLCSVLTHLEKEKQKTLLIGVTYALLDFAEMFPMQLSHAIVMETGGMKGRKKEMLRDEVHSFLKSQLGVKDIHSEYGMTELLSQAYSNKGGKFICPPWMKVLVRNEDDPLDVKAFGKGLLNIIDLANVHSCSFIATDDVGVVHEDGSFEVLGRLDNSDLRGCSLMYN